jgi:hypothetical protein
MNLENTHNGFHEILKLHNTGGDGAITIDTSEYRQEVRVEVDRYLDVKVFVFHPHNKAVRATEAKLVRANNALQPPKTYYDITGLTPEKLAEAQAELAMQTAAFESAMADHRAASQEYHAAVEAQRLEILTRGRFST